MFIREIILICYLVCIILGIAGLTISLLVKSRSRSDFNTAIIWFIAGMLVMSFYDMAIYYCDYVIGVWGNLKVMRLGNCIIAGTMFLWISLQETIIKRETLALLVRLVKRYILFYMTMWILLTVFLSANQFYTLKWLLLATDIILIILFLGVAAAHIIFAATANDKYSLYYMVTVTAMIIWNYISYFWGETSVYWGNSEFIREPLDLTIIFWLIINAVTVVYSYKFDFVPAFSGKNKNVQERKNVKERIDKICEDYKITPREREFLELIYSGKSNKEIADTLFLSESTVKTHIYNIFRKMDIKSRVGIICAINGEEQQEDEDL